MGNSLEGHVAIVTGASRGIGQAIAVRFAAEGAAVVAVGRDEQRRNKEMVGSLDETLQMVRQAGGAAIAAHLDFEDLDFDKGRVVRQAEEAFGASVDILVNNAAAPREFDNEGFIPFAEMPRDFFLRSVAVNLWAAWDLAKAVIPGMRSRGAGWVLSISFLSGRAAPQARRRDAHEPSGWRLPLWELQGFPGPPVHRRSDGALRGQHRRQHAGAHQLHRDTPLPRRGEQRTDGRRPGAAGDLRRGGVGAVLGPTPAS